MKTLNQFRNTKKFRLTNVDLNQLIKCNDFLKEIGCSLVGIGNLSLHQYVARVITLDGSVKDYQLCIEGNRVVLTDVISILDGSN